MLTECIAFSTNEFWFLLQNWEVIEKSHYVYYTLCLLCKRQEVLHNNLKFRLIPDLLGDAAAQVF